MIERHERELKVELIDRRVTYRRVKAREVLGVWRRAARKPAAAVEALRSVG